MVVTAVGLVVLGQLTQLRQKGLGARIVGQLRQGAEHVLASHGKTGADRIRIDADPFELLE
jgi:hypothetical protein